MSLSPFLFALISEQKMSFPNEKIFHRQLVCTFDLKFVHIDQKSFPKAISLFPGQSSVKSPTPHKYSSIVCVSIMTDIFNFNASS